MEQHSSAGRSGFTAEFDFTVAPSAAGEGLAFVLQDQAANALGGSANGSLGYAGISKSLAVELDAHTDVGFVDPLFDAVSVHTNFAGVNSAAESFSLGSSISGAAGDLNNGLSQHAKVSWSPDPQGAMYFRVYLNNAVTPVVEFPFTAAQMQQIFSSGLAYAGFTSNNDTSGAANVTVKNFELASAEPSPSVTTLTTQPSAQDHDVTGQVIVQSRDACNRPVRFGGMVLEATMATDSYQTAVTVTDNSDGTYTLQFTPRVGGNWQLAVTSEGKQ